MDDDAILFPSPALTDQIFKISLVLHRNYHSKQSSTRVDRDYVAVSQYKGKIFYVLVLFLINSFSDTSVQRNLELGEGMVLGLDDIELK